MHRDYDGDASFVKQEVLQHLQSNDKAIAWSIGPLVIPGFKAGEAQRLQNEDTVQSLADRPPASPAAMPSAPSAQDSGSDNVSVIGVVNKGRTRDLSSKRGVALHSLHLAPLVVHRNVASARVACCSWRYGRSSSALVVESSDIGCRHDVAACDNCWKIAEKRGVTVPDKPSSSSSTITTDPVQEEAQDSSSSASSSSSDSS